MEQMRPQINMFSCRTQCKFKILVTRQ